VTVEAVWSSPNEANPAGAGALFIHADKSVNILQTVFLDNRYDRPRRAICWSRMGPAVYASGTTFVRTGETESVRAVRCA
jgi:hypothetical protein